MDIAVAEDVVLTGAWNFYVQGTDRNAEGFVLFYPGGGNHIEYSSGASCLNWSCEVSGRTAVGTIRGDGEW